MLKLTNRLGYHKALVRAIEADSYSKGDSEYSATGLIRPARISALELKHKDELTEDVDDKMFILYGQIAHYILERSGLALDKNITEKRFFATYEVDGIPVVVSAQIDTLSLDIDGTLTDFKFTSVFGFKPNSEPKIEYIQQLNIQLDLLRENKLDAKKLQINGLLRDWRPGEHKKGNYPNKSAIQEIPMWPKEKTVQYIKSRIRAHKKAKTELPECTIEEHWGWKRCAQYCAASKFCTQYQDYKKQKGELKL